MINKTITLTKKQNQTMKVLFGKNGITEVLFGGGAGSGKSFLGCLYVITACLQYEGSRYLIGRSKLTALKQSTLKTLFEVMSMMGLINETDYRYNQSEHYIKFTNGSEIIFKDLFLYPSDPNFDSLGSLEISGAFIDECNQISLKAKNVVMSRIRYKLDDFNIEPKLLMTCNPSKNWVYDEFYKKHKEGTLEDYKCFVQALVTDNKNISQHYITNLEKLDTISKQRLLYGQWEYGNDLALFSYDKILDMFNNDNVNNDTELYMTIDVARLGKDSTVILVFRGLEVIEIKEIKKETLNIQKLVIDEIKNRYKIEERYMVFDVDGVGGGLKDYYPNSRSIINNSRPTNNENYSNLKTQMYYKLSQAVNENKVKINIFTDEHKNKLIQELQVINRENIDQDGKIYMTSKDQIKQQIGRSPDISDALAYRFFFDVNNIRVKNYGVYKMI